MYDVVIVGGGPAGLTATIYCIHKRLETLLISETLGGKTNFHLQLPFVERHQLINGAETVDRFSRELAYLKFARDLEVDGIFVELGHLGNSAAVAQLVDLDESDRIKIDGRNQTTCPGIFVAGDVTDIFAEQVLIALGEGAKAALSCYEYLLEKGLMFDKRQARFQR